MTIRRSPWCFLCTGGPAQGRTLSASWLLITFTRREPRAASFIYLHRRITSHIQINIFTIRYVWVVISWHLHYQLKHSGTVLFQPFCANWNLLLFLLRPSYSSGSKGMSPTVNAPCSSLMRWTRCILVWLTALSHSWTTMTSWMEFRIARQSSSSSGERRKFWPCQKSIDFTFSPKPVQCPF